MSDQNLLALLEKFTAAWNAHDLETLMDCMTPNNCAFYAAAGPKGTAAEPWQRGAAHLGPQAVRAAFEAVWKNFPNAQWKNGKHFVSGNRGLSEWLFTGTSADGKTQVEVNGVDVFEFENGKIKVKDTYRKQISS